MVADNAAAIVGGRNIGDHYYGVHTVANFRDLDVLAVGPVVRVCPGCSSATGTAPRPLPIVAIVGRAYGVADLDAILTRLRQEIAAADYPYPIAQELGSWRRAPSCSTLVLAHGRIIANFPAAVAAGKEADDVVAFIRGGSPG